MVNLKFGYWLPSGSKGEKRKELKNNIKEALKLYL